ncbi:MAG: winged helix-turn-helix transcriptional regulator [Verrucomicrobia bacterium]|nr:winged helix-turn-helix transcriptional regulator [Verrucomicrobiota bacterium]
MRIIPPRLWITCRVIANENRLQLLQEIFTAPRQSVSELSETIGLTLGSTSSQLKMLNSEGFITPHRVKQEVRYDDIILYAPSHIEKLQTSLKMEFLSGSSLQSICKESTGLTHQRRIELVNRLSKSPRSMKQLLDETMMSYSALSRHLNKLKSRNYISYSGQQYHLSNPPGILAKTLLKIATGDLS